MITSHKTLSWNIHFQHVRHSLATGEKSENILSTHQQRSSTLCCKIGPNHRTKLFCSKHPVPPAVELLSPNCCKTQLRTNYGERECEYLHGENERFMIYAASLVRVAIASYNELLMYLNILFQSSFHTQLYVFFSAEQFEVGGGSSKHSMLWDIRISTGI